MKPATIYVICCNDAVMFAVVEKLEHAHQKLEELAVKEFELSKYHYNDYQEYRSICYWHIHSVSGEVEG